MLLRSYLANENEQTAQLVWIDGRDATSCSLNDIAVAHLAEKKEEKEEWREGGREGGIEGEGEGWRKGGRWRRV